jgi:hypothetical protein
METPAQRYLSGNHDAGGGIPGAYLTGASYHEMQDIICAIALSAPYDETQQSSLLRKGLTYERKEGILGKQFRRYPAYRLANGNQFETATAIFGWKSLPPPL